MKLNAVKNFFRLLAICLCCFFFGQHVDARADTVDEIIVDGIYLIEYETGWMLEYYNGDKANVIVPEEVEGRKVIAVAPKAFSGNEVVESVTLPDTVTVMGYDVFYQCSNLREVYLGSVQKALEQHGYDWMLHECPKLERISMSDEANFNMATSSASPMYWTVFYQGVRDNLKYIYLGSNMSNVTEDLFYGPSLEYIEIGENNPLYSSYDGVLYSANGKELLVCGTAYQNETYEIPAGVEKISNPGFQSCHNIKYVVVPETVQEITGGFEDTELTLIVKKNSYADIYAQENGMRVQYDGDASPEYEKHIWNNTYTVDQEATCTMTGIKSIHCRICGKIQEGSEAIIPVMVHQYEGQTVSAKASLLKSGARTEICRICGYVHQTAIPALANVTLSQTEYTYNGAKRTPIVTVADVTGKVLPASYYTITYLTDGKSIGKHIIRIAFQGEYEGGADCTFTIVKKEIQAKKTNNNIRYGTDKRISKPKSTSIIKLKAGKKKVTVKWDKIAAVNGYQLQYSTKRNFKKNTKIVTIRKKKVAKKVLKNLKRGKKYYIRIRTFKVVNGKGNILYSAWSAVKKIKVK